MTTRRPLLALPLLLLARPLWAKAPAWQRTVSEIRIGGVPPKPIAARLGIPVRTLATGLPEALNQGHLEAALLNPTQAAQAASLMGPRLILTQAGPNQIAIRRTLPAPMRADLQAALLTANA